MLYMVRTQIQLTEQQHHRLKMMAAETRTSVAELLRRAVELVLDEGQRSEHWTRLWEVCGSAEDPTGATDVASRHDDYLAEGFARDLGLR